MRAHRFAEVLKTQGNYQVPVHADVPDSNVIFIDAHDPHVHALGTKTIGMLGNDGISGAIANAIFHATGKRPRLADHAEPLIVTEPRRTLPWKMEETARINYEAGQKERAMHEDGNGTMMIRLHINGARYDLQLEPRVSLLDALREYLGLSGTKKGCNQGACGACTVLVDGERINSCFALAVQYQGREITTIEGVAAADQLHPLQAAFIDYDGFQCGYCTPGHICSAIGMVEEYKQGMPSAVTNNLAATDIELSEAEIKERMSGNLCRCGAYVGIVEAIREAFTKEVAR